jgi:hypothetical protein
MNAPRSTGPKYRRNHPIGPGGAAHGGVTRWVAATPQGRTRWTGLPRIETCHVVVSDVADE